MSISVIATGDSFITQRLPHNDAGCQMIKAELEKADARFTNFEMLLHDFEVSPSAVSGGTWAAARPQVLEDLQWLGFNLYAWANNHTLDWGHDGLLTTLRHFEKADCVHAGVGRDLAEAGQPKYLDTPRGRVALIGVASSAQDWHRAGARRPDVMGRPGLNLLRFQAVHKVNQEDFDRLKQIVSQTEVNARREQREKDGFVKPEEGGLLVGTIRFEVGEPGTETTVHKQDAERIVKSIKEAARQADVVLVSHHVHEMKGTAKNQPPDFMRQFAHLCIDSGAHAVLGHGPHILRGIEIYQNRPICYSLGNFIFQNNSVERQPAEFYDTYGLGPGNTPSDAFDARSANGNRGLGIDPKVFESVMVAFTVEDDKIRQVELIPVSLGFNYAISRKGRPYPARSEDAKRILSELAALSAPFGTVISVENDRGVISI